MPNPIRLPIAMRHTLTRPAVTALAVLLLACADTTAPGEPLPMVPALITKLAGDNQSGIVGLGLATAPRVRVSDASANPVAGVTVTFAVASGGGSIVGPTATTDSAGLATLGGWTLGATPGANTVTASVESISPVTFFAMSTAAAAYSLAGDGQSATVGAPVAVHPAVRVVGANDAPVAGVTVTFAIVPGSGGSVTGGHATTAANGVATLGSWTLATVPGINTLVAVVTGLPPVMFTATGVTGPVASLVKIAGDGMSGVAGAPIVATSRPAVRLADAHGNPVPGAQPVVFAVSSGGGTVTGAAATTDAQGVATVGGWVLGTTAGPNTMTATSPGIPPVIFTITGQAGTPAVLAKLAGDAQAGSIGFAVPTRPAVSVTDALGNPVEGATVTFSVTAGGGAVAFGTVGTNSAGVAAADWTLGSTAGTNTLHAAVSGLPAVTFTATAVDACTAATPYAIGSSVNGVLSVSDCRMFAGEYTDRYAATVPGVASLRFSMASSAFSSHVSIADANGSPVASSPYFCADYYYCVATNAVRVLLAAGSYVVGVGGFEYDYSDFTYGGVVGPYTLASASVPEDVNGCETIYVMPGVTTSQQVQATDCSVAFRAGFLFWDEFTLHVEAGRAYTITMSSSAFDTYLELLGPVFGSALRNDDFGGTTNSQITITPTVSGQYVIRAGTSAGDRTGSYTLSIQ
jgi:hypothetical protein